MIPIGTVCLLVDRRGEALPQDRPYVGMSCQTISGEMWQDVIGRRGYEVRFRDGLKVGAATHALLPIAPPKAKRKSKRGTETPTVTDVRSVETV